MPGVPTGVLRLAHHRYRRFVDAFVDGELDGDLRRRVGAHVAECPMCGRDAELTVHVKHSLARRGLVERLRRRPSPG
ncbi:MAG: zf-HC2 domain-containing protein [Acidimicrobiaceae bacterium]|nr:zf-HC2 domain-containing protein [Acidimicrobiaceae bacterium]